MLRDEIGPGSIDGLALIGSSRPVGLIGNGLINLIGSGPDGSTTKKEFLIGSSMLCRTGQPNYLNVEKMGQVQNDKSSANGVIIVESRDIKKIHVGICIVNQHIDKQDKISEIMATKVQQILRK